MCIPITVIEFRQLSMITYIKSPLDIVYLTFDEEDKINKGIEMATLYRLPVSWYFGMN